MSRDGTERTAERGATAGSSEQPSDRRPGIGRRVLVLGLVVGVFALAVGISRGVTALAETTVGVGESGTVSGLLAGVLGLQVLGFGLGAALVLSRRADPRSYLRVGKFDATVAFRGTAVGLALMLVASAATLVFRVLDIEAAESAAGSSQDPLFYLVLLVVSTVVAVPMEEVFFRGILQRSLAAVWHPAVAIGVASGLFASVHASVTVGSGGEAIALALFFSLGLTLGISYHLTENLLVPVVGHVVFNGAQILVRGLEVAAS